MGLLCNKLNGIENLFVANKTLSLGMKWNEVE